MIRNDHVTYVHYYKNRISSLQQSIFHKEKYYGEVKYYFFVTEFHNRGIQHDHVLLLIKDAPTYGTNTISKLKHFLTNTCHAIQNYFQMRSKLYNIIIMEKL